VGSKGISGASGSAEISASDSSPGNVRAGNASISPTTSGASAGAIKVGVLFVAVSNQGRRTPPAKRRLVRKLPTLKWWQRRLIAWLRLYFPWLTRFMRFSPGTYIRWLQAKARKGQYSFDFI
jgi:hypothetical protein